MMGMIQTFVGRSSEAVDYLKRAMRLDPHNTGAYLYYLGLAQYCLEKYDEAVTSLERSQKLNPQYGPWPLAITYAQLNRGQEAADILAKYFDKRGWSVVFIENTFKYWPFKNQKDIDHWAEGLRKSGLMRPWNPIYRREYEKAIADAEQAIIRNPENAKAQYAMGETLVFCGRSEEAIDYLKKAISLDPEYPGYYFFTLGVAQFCLERYDEAASSLEICLFKRKMHENPPMWLLVATYAYMGKQIEAEDVLKKNIKENEFVAYTVDRVLMYYLHAFKDPRDTERFAKGLQMAGLHRN
jgi:tetratricopeptide (TPR) repeat protein